jgi:hypothetical protein
MSFVSRSAVHTKLISSGLHLLFSAKHSGSTSTLSPIIEQVCLGYTTLCYRLSDRTLQLAESNRGLILPFMLTGTRLIFSPKTAAARSLYAAIHSSTSISSRPSIIAISLYDHMSKRLLESRSTYPPVLVPPIRSNTSHGFTGGRLAACFCFWFS